MINRAWAFPLIIIGFIFSVSGCCKDDDGSRIGKTTAVFNPDKTYGTVKDIDGNEYKTITVGTQTWMAENLRTTRYRNGEPIPNVKDAWDWESSTAGAYCSYENTRDVDSIATYGLLYNGLAVTDARGIAPEGWHVPTDAEWEILIRYLSGGDSTLAAATSGGKLKEVGTNHWAYPNRFADNSSGFTAVPNGWRETYQGNFAHKGFSADYWSSSEYFFPLLLARGISTDFGGIGRYQFPRSGGLAVRCLKN